MVQRLHPSSVLLIVSPGEAIDRLSILRLKVERIAEPQKRANVGVELAMVLEACNSIALDEEGQGIADEIAEVNAHLWDIEDELRVCERREAFGEVFVALARSVYLLNDRRADAKRRLNLHLGSLVLEEKSYR